MALASVTDVQTRRDHNGQAPLPIQSTPLHPTSLRPTLILSSHLHLGIPSDLFSSDLPTKTIYALLLSHVRAHLKILDLITVITSGEEYRS